MPTKKAPSAKAVVRALARAPHAVVSPSAFSERDAIWVNGREIAHVDAAESSAVAVDLRLGRARIRTLARDGRLTRRSAASDWVAMRIASRVDLVDAARWIAEVAAENAPRPGERAAEPPVGPALARRRRFH